MKREKEMEKENVNITTNIGLKVKSCYGLEHQSAGTTCSRCNKILDLCKDCRLPIAALKVDFHPYQIVHVCRACFIRALGVQPKLKV